jgi:hypothetical protein
MRAPLLVLAGFAIAAALIAWSRWLSRRRWAAAGNLLLAVVAALAAGMGWPIVRHLETYETAVHGRAIASIHVEKSGSHRQRVALTHLPSGRMQVFELTGDEWRLVVRELGWMPAATALGLEPLYRIESLDSRDSSASDQRAPTVIPLAEAHGFDLWAGATPGSVWSKAAVPGARMSRWEPLADGERFEIHIEGDGLAVERSEATASAAGASSR